MNYFSKTFYFLQSTMNFRVKEIVGVPYHDLNQIYGRKRGWYKLTSSFYKFVDWVRREIFLRASGTKISQSTFDNNFCFSYFVSLLYSPLPPSFYFVFRYTWLVFLSLRKTFSQVDVDDQPFIQQD